MAPLERYLNEHLAGSGAALSLLETLIAGHAADRAFYEAQRDEILQSRRMLEDLMRRGGFQKATWMELSARMASALVQWRLKSQGLQPGKLALVEALEALTLGLSGQILLWCSLRDSLPRIGAWQGVDFDALKQRAENQRVAVEARRLTAAHQAFFPA
jgi:hypothetical protein